ncbi:DUF6221 family protein [Streptomyces chartreusis]
MDELVEWLSEQLDEDKRMAQAATWCEEAGAWHAAPSPFGARDKGQRWYVEDAMDDGVVSHVDPRASDDQGAARHIAEWDPARVLREIDAKRRILATLREEGGDRMFADIFQLLALPYADRPGYREQWRP